MRVLVCGSRDYDNAAAMNTILLFVNATRGITAIIQGEARGADLMAKAWAIKHNIRHIDFPADWKKYGKAAGPIRNKQMLDEGQPDLVLAFPKDGDLAATKGTKNMVYQAKEAGIEVVICGE